MHGLTDEPVSAGLPDPLGVTPVGGGLNVALWAGGAEAVDFCVRHPDGSETRYRLPERTDGVYHGFVPNHGVGTRYGFRVHGPWDPAHGSRWNPAKLLLDPYARAVGGRLVRNPAVYAHRINPYSPEDDSQRDERDSAPYVPYAIVTGDDFDWGGDRRLHIPWADTVLYEAHVKSLTRLHPGVPESLRGTYAGLAHDAVLEHLTSLGVTSVELLPVQHFLPEEHLADAGMPNLWGYNTIGFFAPHAAYASVDGTQVQEFKAIVRRLHEAGLEVILDVVYNHTAEGGQRGPTLSFRGIDNAGYYKLAEDRRYYRDYVGTGNTLDVSQPHVLRLVMDSLRYWVTEMHVDGFRFDLASALVRGHHDVQMSGAFLQAIGQDPVLRTVKLIAEPWDVGAGGYQVGHFPGLWSEWNDKFRDTVRDFWRGAAPGIADLGWRLSGSADLYASARRKPRASVNFVTAHDGFTLRDLVSYNEKHNIANGEMNRDGSNDNRSWNHGVEGPTDDEAVLELRARQQRNLLATLALSLGVPMLTMGDEVGRTQLGNNNAYCQDNELSWVHWNLDEAGEDLLAFTRRVLALRAENPAFRRPYYRWGQVVPSNGAKDLAWLGPDGLEIGREQWNSPDTRTIGMFVNGAATAIGAEDGDSFLVILHAGATSTPFVLPGAPYAVRWETEIDTGAPAYATLHLRHTAGDTLRLEARSLVVLRALSA